MEEFLHDKKNKYYLKNNQYNINPEVLETNRLIIQFEFSIQKNKTVV